MGEFQPDLLGGKPMSGRRTPKARKNARIKPVPAGHADKPGTGPEGETCGGCVHMVDFHFRRTFHKCDARAGDVWKGGRSTDVRPLDAACSKFSRKANALPKVWIEEAAAIPAEYMERLEKIGTADRGSWLCGDWSDSLRVADAMLEALRTAPHGLTTDEVAIGISQAPAVVRPRLSELHKAGKIRKAPERRPGAAGRTLAVWLINEEGEQDGNQPRLV